MSLAVADGGRLLAWGRCLDGQAGTGAQETYEAPVQVPEASFEGSQVVAGAAGRFHSVVMTGMSAPQRCDGVSCACVFSISCCECRMLTTSIRRRRVIFGWCGNN